jgi:N-acetylneuraminic acid mutarotase
VAGSRHTTTLAGDRLFVLGASDSGTFKDCHALDIDTLSWLPVEASGQAPLARSRHTSTLVGKNLVVFGGVGGGRPLNDLFVMHTTSTFWTEPPVNGIAPTQRVGHAATLVGTKVFIFGGHDGKACLNDVHILVTMNWRAVSTKGGRPTPRVSCTMNTVGSKLFLIGGASGEKAFNDVRVLDLEAGIWTVPTVSGTPPPALVGHSSTLIGNELFIFGGSDGKQDGNELHMFDTDTLSWSLPSLEGRPPMARVGQSGNAVGATKIYFFGGYGVRLGYVSDTHVLDTALLSWTKPYINGTPPLARVGHAAVVIGTKLYVIAGASAGKVLTDAHVLDTSSMSWIEPPTGGLAPGPLFGHTAQAVGRCIFVFGGCSDVPQHGRSARLTRRIPSSNKIHVLDADTLTWSKPNVAGIIPFPRYRHAAALAGSQMYAFGGFGGGSDLYALDTGIMDDNRSDRELSRRRKRGGAGAGSDQGNELISWLEGLGLGKYTRVFIRQELDFDTLVELTPSDLREMGITALGPRKKLAAAISSMRGVGQGKYSTADLYQGRYKLEESSSMGGLNMVKLALDMKTERRVALKFMGVKEDFVREVSFLKQLRSEYVVELIDYYEDPHEKQHCIVLEFGQISLADYLKKGALQRNERKFVVDRLAHIVQHMHSHNVVHCDIKPHNFVLFGLKWKVIDLESARRAGEPVSMKVSPSYCSPELARAVLGKQADRMRAACTLDMWSFGLVFFELFARQPYFADKPDTMQQLASYAELEVPKDIVDDIQARHVLKKLLVKHHVERANVQAVLKHAYLCGGMDTIQKASSFGYLQQTQQQLQLMLTDLSSHVKAA